MKESILVRMNLLTLKKIKRVFYARHEESLSSYFERLSKHLETLQQWDGLAK